MTDPRLGYLPEHLRGKTVLTVEDVLPVIGLSERSLREMIRKGEFPHIRAGRRVLIPIASFLDWLDRAGS